MTRIKIMSFAVVAVLAISAMSAAAASAREPGEFVYAGGGENGFTGTSGAGTLETEGGVQITCQHDTNEGKITASGKDDVQKVFVTFTECKLLGKNCTTVGQATGTVKTNELEGELEEAEADGVVIDSKLMLALVPKGGVGNFAEFSCGATKVSVKGLVNGLFEYNEDTHPSVTSVVLSYKQEAGVKGEQELDNSSTNPETELLETTIGETKDFAAIKTDATITHEKAVELLSTP